MQPPGSSTFVEGVPCGIVKGGPILWHEEVGAFSVSGVAVPKSIEPVEVFMDPSSLGMPNPAKEAFGRLNLPALLHLSPLMSNAGPKVRWARWRPAPEHWREGSAPSWRW